jgi:hypothetical protein
MYVTYKGKKALPFSMQKTSKICALLFSGMSNRKITIRWRWLNQSISG